MSTGPVIPCLALLRVGVTEPPESPRTLVRSYRTVSPLPVLRCRSHRRSALCCPNRQVAPSWLSPAPCPLESRLSSTSARGRGPVPRPPSRLTVTRECTRRRPATLREEISTTGLRSKLHRCNLEFTSLPDAWSSGSLRTAPAILEGLDACSLTMRRSRVAALARVRRRG